MINPKKSSKMLNLIPQSLNNNEGPSMKMLNINSTKKKFYCEICKLEFKNEKTYLEHIKQHVDFVCSLCGEHFRKEKTRDIHEANRFCQNDSKHDTEKEIF